MDDAFHELRNRAYLAWSEWAATDVVDELLMGKLLTSEQVAFAKEIVAQQLNILRVSGFGPDHPKFSS